MQENVGLLFSLLLSSLELSDTKVYEPQIRALLGTASHFCEVIVPKLRSVAGADPGGAGEGLRPARPGRARLGTTLEPLLTRSLSLAGADLGGAGEGRASRRARQGLLEGLPPHI